MNATQFRALSLDDPKGSRRVIEGDELNRAYALMDQAEADRERTTIAAVAALIRTGAFVRTAVAS